MMSVVDGLVPEARSGTTRPDSESDQPGRYDRFRSWFVDS